jgi:hypothetical protein
MRRPAWAIPVAIVAVVAMLVGLVTCSSSPPDQQSEGSAPPSSESSPAVPHSPELADTPAPPSVEEPLDLIPAENLLCWKGLPFPGAVQNSDEPSSLRTLLDLAGRLFGSRIDNTQKISVRILETLGIIGRYPFAVSLIDASAKPARTDGSGAKLDQLRIAAVIRTGSLDESKAFLRIIQKALNEVTDAGAATLETKRVQRWEYTELTDTRLPEWCAVAWGQLDEHFVISVGRDVWPLIAAVAAGDVQSVGRDRWVTQVRRQRSEEPLIEVLVATKEIRQRLDPFVGGRATAFFKAWHAEDVERMHWALGFQGSALYCRADFRDESTTQHRLYANPDIREQRLLRTIPEGSRYAVYRLPARTFLPRLVSSFYATRSPEDQQAAAEVWAKIQADLKIDAQRDALDHLGEYIVAHNYPPHPFHLPLAFTSLIEIRDEPQKVQQTLEKLLTAWQEAIDAASDEQGTTSPLQICHDEDGVWHVQFLFIHGVAWVFTDRFIVTSWSPIALREYLGQAGDVIGKRQ